MKKHHIIEDTIQILESIVERANIIQHDPDREMCLDIDLMLEDLRLLYRNYEALKKHCEAGQFHKTIVDKSEDTIPEEGQHIPSFFAEEELEEEEKSVADIHAPASSEKPAKAPQKPVQAYQAPAEKPQPELHRTEQNQQAQSPANQPAGSPAGTPPDSSENQPAASHAGRPVDFYKNQPAASPSSPPAALPGQSEKNNPGDVKGSNGKTIIDLFTQHQTRSIGDQFGHDDNSLHQRISGQKEDKSIGARLQQHPINNIKDAIGLNEKFLFINELFEGDIQVYNEAIAKLNNMGTIKEAFDYLNELTAVHHWDAKRSAETIEKLAGFVQRRYLDR